MATRIEEPVTARAAAAGTSPARRSRAALPVVCVLMGPAALSVAAAAGLVVWATQLSEIPDDTRARPSANHFDGRTRGDLGSPAGSTGPRPPRAEARAAPEEGPADTPVPVRRKVGNGGPAPPVIVGMSSRRNRGLMALAAAGLVIGAVALPRLPDPAAALRDFLRDPFRMTSRAGLSGPVVLEQVQQLQRLEACRYQGHAVVKGDRSGPLPVWLAGDRILFLGRGEVVAGIDLARMRPEDVRVGDGTVALRLPAPEILYSRLDNRQSEVYDRRSGLLTGPDPSLEGKVRLEAEEQIRRAAVEGGLLARAETSARDLLRRHLTGLGFHEVRFL